MGKTPDFKLVPVRGASLLSGIGVGNAHDASNPLLTMTPEKRLGIDMPNPKATLHVGGDVVVEGPVHTKCIYAQALYFDKGGENGGNGSGSGSGTGDARIASLEARIEALEIQLRQLSVTRRS